MAGDLILIGIDPSYQRTGISIYYNGTICLSEVRGKEKLGIEAFDKSFEGVFRESGKIVRCVKDEILLMETFLNCNEFASRYIISECPPPQGQYSPGLYALDTRMFGMYWTLTNQVYRVYPTYAGHIHGKKKYPKSDSVKLAKEILKYYDHKILTKQLSHDESESLIFLSRLLYLKGLMPEELVNKIPNIKNEKEKLFSYQ